VVVDGARERSCELRAGDAPPGYAARLGFTFSFVYHFCNGIRHLVWDTGRGLERAQARRSGRVVITAAVVLTALIVWFGCAAIAPGVAP
jgi:succinate dehydrogenase cytochrome b556 subunit